MNEEKQLNMALAASLYRKLKLRAARDGKMLKALVAEAINEYFKNNK